MSLKAWDVVVFKNPAEPPVNYIKRLIALPGETVQIIDGDIYINGKIMRKPPKVQNELWMPVYNNDYQPVDPVIPAFGESGNLHQWKQPFVCTYSSMWVVDSQSPTLFKLDSSEDKINSLVYDTSLGNDFKTRYAYNDFRRNENMPYSSDLMVRFYCEIDKPQGRIGIKLGKYQTEYKGWIDFKGEMIISRNNEEKPLAQKIIMPVSSIMGN